MRLGASERSIYDVAIPLIVTVILALTWLLPFSSDARRAVVVLSLLGLAYFACTYWFRIRRGWERLRYLSPLVGTGLVTAAMLFLGAQATATYLCYVLIVLVHSIRYGRTVGLVAAGLSALGYYLVLQFTSLSPSPLYDFVLVTTILFLVASLSGAMLNEGRYRLLFDSLTNYAVCMMDARGHITDWNSGAERIKGYKPNEIIGKHCSILYPSDENERGIPNALLSLAAVEGRWEGEGWRLRKNGSQFWASVAITSLRDEAGNLQGFAQVTRDLSARKQIEQALQDAKENLEVRVLERTAELEAVNENLRFELSERMHAEDRLRESEERYRLLAENSLDLIGLLDLEGTILYASPSHARVLGYAPDELLQHNLFKLMHPNDVPRVRSVVNDLLAAVTASHTLEVRLRNRTEDWVQLEAILSAVGEPSEVVNHILFSARDISGRRRAEVALRESEELYRSLVETSPDAIALTDLSNNILMVNQQAVKLFGYNSAAELIGQNTMDLIDPQDHLRAIGNAVWIMETGEVQSIEYTLRKKDGSTFPADYCSTLVMDEAEQRPTVINWVRDISERKRVEEALRESEARFRAIFEQAAVGMALRDMAGQSVELNPAVRRMLGYSGDELPDKGLLGLIHPEDGPETSKLIEEISQGQREQFQQVNRYVHKDGRVVWGRSKVTLLRSAQAEPRFIFTMVEDISEQRHIEEALRKTNSQLTEGLNTLEQRHREAVLLNQMGDLLQTCIRTEEARSIILKHMPNLFPDESGALFEFNPVQNLVEAVGIWGEPIISERVFAPDDCWALRRERIYVISDAAAGFICPHLNGDSASAARRGYLCVPMMAQGELLGMLHIQSRHDNYPSEAKRELAETVAERVALALTNIKLRETLRIQSIRDPLTGVFNRRYMEESLPRELRRAARNRRALGVIMLDLDHFKQFNDTFGHEAGNALLRELGTFLQANVRGEDIVCRYGGEEFTLILPDAGLEDSRQRAEQMRKAVKALQVSDQGKPLGPITISFGVSVFPDHGSTAEALLRAADAALYRAKAAGRDCVVAGGE